MIFVDTVGGCCELYRRHCCAESADIIFIDRFAGATAEDTMFQRGRGGIAHGNAYERMKRFVAEKLRQKILP